MKKGFLFSSGKSKDDKTSQQKEQNNSRTPQADIPLIKAKDPAANSLKMPEVEEALSSAQSFLSNKGVCNMHLGLEKNKSVSELILQF